MSDRKNPFPEKDQALRDEVRILGALLGEVIIDQEGQGLFEEVEAIRRDAIDRRRGDAAAERRLIERISALPPARLATLIEAFSAYFSLVNQAERIHRIRRRREYHRPGAPAQPGSIEGILEVLRDRGATLTEVRGLLESLRIEPVFTAHPTEAIRPEILVKEQRIARALIDGLERRDPTPSEELSSRDRIVAELTTAWQTDGARSEKPQVTDEVDQVVFFLTRTIYAVLPRFYEEIEEALDLSFAAGATHASGDGAAGGVASADGPPEPKVSELDLSGLLRFVSWVGGDMDGNPNVGADTLGIALTRQRSAILTRYRAEAQDLADRLTQTTNRVGVDPELQARLGRSPDDRVMPYRLFFLQVADRLERMLGMGRDDASLQGADPSARVGDHHEVYRDAEELIADLRLVERSLEQNRGWNAGRFRVRRFRRRVEAFGFHLASVDVRQDALVHRRAVGELLGHPGFADLEEVERTRLLVETLESGGWGGGAASRGTDRSGRDRVGREDVPLSAETERTLAVFRAIADARRIHGERAIGIYIISMARGPDDALAVLCLARAAGLGRGAGETLDVPLDISPLFETVSDLEAAHTTLRRLFGQPLYRRHLERRGAQFVMLGYSDSSKDSGLAASRWALYRVQQSLMGLSDESGVPIRLFHGRGGTISRGGSKTHAAVLSQPRGTVRGHLRATEQGEVLQAKYGLRGIALRSFELVTSAVIEATAPASRDSAEEVNPAASASAGSAGERFEIAEMIASAARSAYRALAHEEPDFIRYFREATPIDVVERLQIGSRPPSRREQNGVADLRAIPWVFAWTQSRLVLPGWYGVGTGLERARDAFGVETLRRLSTDWRFLATLLGDVEMVLAKADLEIAGRYAELAGEVGARLFPRMREEFLRTEEMILTIRDSGDLLFGDPVLRRAIRLRNPYVDPMSFAQVDLLARWREGGRNDDVLLQALFRTVRGISRGLKNTG